MENQNIECSVCNRSFKTLGGLRGHNQWKHAEVVGAGPTVASPALEIPEAEFLALSEEDRQLLIRYGIQVPPVENVGLIDLEQGLFRAVEAISNNLSSLVQFTYRQNERIRVLEESHTQQSEPSQRI